jgi:DNA-binding CsgD family transcriptional regulator
MRSPQLAGRERDLAALGQALVTRPAVVLIEGEAGIGKSRLVREFLVSAAGRGHRSLLACCPPFRRPHTLGPVSGALREAVTDVAGVRLSALAGALRPLFPEWTAALPPAPEPAEDATAARHRVFAALAELLTRLKVSLLVVEDVHWADEATVEFLIFLASACPRPVSLVATWRPEDVPAGTLLLRLSRLAAGDSGVRLTLRPLDVTQTAGMMSSMLAGEPVSADFAAFVHQHTEGVPLSVEESVRLMADRDDLFRRAGGWERRRPGDIAIPPTLRDAVLERAGRLSPDAQAVLRAAAVLADPEDDATVRAVARLSAARAQRGLCAALGSGLLCEGAHGRLSFRHVLAGRAVYEAIPGPLARALHLRAGRTVEGRSPPPAARLARHFREAGQADKWSLYAERAADLALASGDEASAMALLSDLIVDAGLPVHRAIGLIDKITFTSLPDPASYAGLAGALRALLNTGIGDTAEEAIVRFQLGRLLGMMEEHEASRAELERAVPHLAHDPVRAARAMTLLGYPDSAATAVSEHLRWVRRAAEVSASLPPADRLCMLVDRTTVLLMLGEEDGWADAAQIPWDAGSCRHRQLITRGQLNAADMAVTWGRYPDARQRLTRALALAEANNYPRYRETILASSVHLDWFTGAWDGLAARARSLASNDEGQPGARLDAALVTALLHSAAGALPQAEDQLQFVITERQQRGEFPYLMEPAAALASLRLATGRADDAVAVTDGPVAVLADKGIWVWATDIVPARVNALVAAGRASDAAELVAAFAHGLRGRDAPAPTAGLVLCGGILASARGEHARAARLFARAAAAWQALPRPYDALLARERQGRCLLAAGQAEASLRVLSGAAEGLQWLRDHGDLGRMRDGVKAYGARSGAARRPGRPSYGDNLSPRELDVVRLLVTGRTNRQIADVLVVSIQTVASHLHSAMRKLRVTSRTGLAVTAVELGLVPTGQSEPGPEPPAERGNEKRRLTA